MEVETDFGELEISESNTTSNRNYDKRRNSKDDPKQLAMRFFDCSYKQMTSFRGKVDPFNPSNTLDGLICKKDGPMGGSLYITHVNNIRLPEAQQIYGTPKLEYPYQDFDDYDYKDFENLKGKCKDFVVANKWNGTNVLFFKYKDHNNNTFVTAKSKGSYLLSNSPFGEFLTLTLKVVKTLNFKNLPTILSELKDDQIQSKIFELCGKDEPHLVNYNFSVALKPLFVTYIDGTIAPCKNSDDLGPLPFVPSNVGEVCSKLQIEDFNKNEEYRKANNLEHKYEHNHFIVEGRVLYLLDINGKLINRTMYKIKPKDIEEVHWANFDATIQGRVRECYEKIILRGKQVTERALQEELDMGPKEWGRFGNDVWKYVKNLMTLSIPSVNDDSRVLLLVCGYPGSGREQLVETLRKKGWKILSGNDTESNKEQLKLLFAKNHKVVIDRWNITVKQRRPWLEEGLKLGVLKVDCVYFDVPIEKCKEIVEARRVGKRTDAGVLHEEDQCFTVSTQKPQGKECFGTVKYVKSEQDIDSIVSHYCQ